MKTQGIWPKLMKIWFGRSSPRESKPQPQLQRLVKLAQHKAVCTQPAIPKEVGSELIKENYIFQNPLDPDHFNHFLAHIYHPQKLMPTLPAILLIPGMLCNGNFFRMSPQSVNFRNLDFPSSFANFLAFEGFHIVLVNPRYSQWIYTRYTYRKLGIKNYFSDAVDFERLVNDLAFYIDVALEITKTRRIAILGFSMGGMELIYYLTTKKIDPRISHIIFAGTPVEFSKEQTIVTLLSLYNSIARLQPFQRYRALNLLARHILPIKSIMSILPPKILISIPLSEVLFNPDQINLEQVIPFINYVLEPMPTPVIEYLIDVANKREILDQSGKPILPLLSSVSVPALIISGERDRLVSPSSNSQLYQALGSSKKKLVEVKSVGHLDLICGKNFAEAASQVNKLIKS